jgi:membrane protein DedA with SNARE-associated domain
MMSDIVVLLIGAVPSGFVGFQLGRWWHAERLARIARNLPRDSVVLATLERLERESRRP